MLLRRERHDVLVVEPVELGLVEDRRARREPLELELGDQTVHVEHLVLAVRPAEQRQVVHDRLRQVAELAEVAHRRGAVALAELAAVGPSTMEWWAKRGTGAPSAANSSSWRAVLVRWSSPRMTCVMPMSRSSTTDGEVVAGDAVGAHDDEVADGARTPTATGPRIRSSTTTSPAGRGSAGPPARRPPSRRRTSSGARPRQRRS